MQVHFSYQHGSTNPQLEKIIHMNVGKLDRLLVRFSPDLIHLHGLLDFNTATQGSTCSLNLWLPTAQLHATEQGRDVTGAVRTGFSHLLEQLKKHKQVLRRECEWKRKRYKAANEDRKVELGELRVQDRQQLREYLDQVLPQLKLFIERELRYQEMSGGLEIGIQQEEIISEVAARALGDPHGFFGHPAPYHRLLREAIQVLNGSTNGDAGSSKSERFADRPGPDRVRDGIDAIELCLAALPTKHRQVYLLHALEGFSYEEAAQVMEQLPSEVEEAFQQAKREVAATLQESRRNDYLRQLLA